MDHDDLLDKAIASYLGAEPGLGFVPRLLNRSMARQRRWHGAAIPIAAAAAAACLAVFTSVTPPQAVSQRGKAPSPRMEVPPVPRASRTQRPGRKRNMSLHPAAVNNQESLLARWVAQSPEKAGAEFFAMREHLKAPIEIKVLKFELLTVEELSQ